MISGLWLGQKQSLGFISVFYDVKHKLLNLNWRRVSSLSEPRYNVQLIPLHHRHTWDPPAAQIKQDFLVLVFLSSAGFSPPLWELSWWRRWLSLVQLARQSGRAFQKLLDFCWKDFFTRQRSQTLLFFEGVINYIFWRVTLLWLFWALSVSSSFWWTSFSVVIKGANLVYNEVISLKRKAFIIFMVSTNIQL